MVDMFFREFKPEEIKAGVVDVTKTSIEKEFLRKVAKKEEEYMNKHKPFCTKCAMNAFEAAKRQLEFDWEKRNFKANREFAEKTGNQLDSIKLDIGDLDAFGEDSHFVLLSEKEVTEKNPMLKTAKRSIGVHKNFACKKYGYGVTVFIPTEYLEETTQPSKK